MREVEIIPDFSAWCRVQCKLAGCTFDWRLLSDGVHFCTIEKLYQGRIYKNQFAFTWNEVGQMYAPLECLCEMFSFKMNQLRAEIESLAQSKAP